jgi:hypothetical protein
MRSFFIVAPHACQQAALAANVCTATIVPRKKWFLHGAIGRQGGYLRGLTIF